MSNLLKLTPENYYTKEANMQYVSVSQYKEFNGTTGKMGCEAYAMAKLRGEVEEVTTTALMVGSYVDAQRKKIKKGERGKLPNQFLKGFSLSTPSLM